MEWKKISNWLLDDTEDEIVEKESLEPVSIEDIEQAIELMNAAHKIDTSFKASLILPFDTFEIDSDTFKSIKLQKTKKEGNKIVVMCTDALMSTETTIDIANIHGIIMNISFTTKREQI